MFWLLVLKKKKKKKNNIGGKIQNKQKGILSGAAVRDGIIM